MSDNTFNSFKFDLSVVRVKMDQDCQACGVKIKSRDYAHPNQKHWYCLQCGAFHKEKFCKQEYRERMSKFKAKKEYKKKTYTDYSKATGKQNSTVKITNTVEIS